MFPTDAKLLHRARERLVRLAKEKGVILRQSYARVGKHALIRHQRYAHAHQFKTQLGRFRGLTAPPEPRPAHSGTSSARSRARKSWHRMERNYLAHSTGDAINAVLAAAGYNFRLLLRWLALLCAQILRLIISLLRPETQLRPA